MKNPLKKLLLALTIFTQLFSASPALAHRPDKGLDLGITVIPDAQTSYAYYRELGSESLIHVYQIELRAGEFFHAGINIPQLERLQDFGVEMLLIGPGLPAFDLDSMIPVTGSASSFRTSLREVIEGVFQLGRAGAGAAVAPSELTEPFFEPFTQTNYWGRQTLELDAPQSGTFFLIVWNAQGLPGKYVLDTGTEEVFGLADIFRFPVWWWETRLYFEQGTLLTAYAVGGIIAISALILYRRNRRLAAARA